MRLELEDNDAEELGQLLMLLQKGSDVKVANNFIRDTLNADPEIWTRIGSLVVKGVSKRKERIALYGNKDEDDKEVL